MRLKNRPEWDRLVQVMRHHDCMCCGRNDPETARVSMVKGVWEVYCGRCPVGYDDTGRVVIDHQHDREGVESAQ
ncbi:MAG: hypothetical protein ACLGIB_12495 [Actinomycetota bacterium]